MQLASSHQTQNLHQGRNLIKMEKLSFRWLIFFLVLNPSKILAGEVVAPELLSFFNENKVADVIITFKSRPEDALKGLSEKLKSVRDRTQKLTMLSDELEALALSSQKSALEILTATAKTDMKFYTLWITNQLSIRGASMDLIQKLSSVQEIVKIKQVSTFGKFLNDSIGNESQEFEQKKDFGKHLGLAEDDLLSWAINRVKAPEVWELGYDGTGVRVGLIDTGVRWTVDCYQESYVGTRNLGWFDPKLLTDRPRDAKYMPHGTPVLLSMVADYGLGVAPGAKWMACPASEDNGIFREDWIKMCFQFMICPTDYQGNNRDCSKAPRVINNSYYYIPDEDDSGFREMVPVLVATDITMVFCIGNLGSFGCKSSGAPGNYAEFIGIGCTNIDDEVHYGSSHGPSPAGTIKPDLVAPGKSVIIAEDNSDSFYHVASGTSFAAPIVSGIVALMLQKNPNLTKEEIRGILIKSTDPAKVPEGDCEGVSNTQVPNNWAGYGIINALKAVNNVPTF